MALNHYNILAANHPCSVFSRALVPLQSHSAKITPSNRSKFTKTLKCIAADESIARRSGNYKPTIWQYDYIQSIKSDYSGNVHAEKAAKLKEYVKQRLEKVKNPLDKFEILNEIYNNDNYDMRDKEELYATSLKFRLFRQHGYKCSHDMFNIFKDDEGKFKAGLSTDTKGMLCLYEATFLSVKGEIVLEEAKEFSTKYLKESLEKGIDADLAKLVAHALELPLHWRIPRLEARWFIDVYRKRPDMNPIILEFAILDFNIVQAIHQEDLKQMSRWCKNTGLEDKLSFARNRLVENFLWTVEKNFVPRFEYYRRATTKFNILITMIDDVYDVYGTLEELELFTTAVERWDLSAMDQLPDYMKICYFALFNSTNDTAYDILKEEGLLVISYLKKTWVDLCKMFMLEAKWFHSGYKPTFDEYMNIAWISGAAPLMLVHDYILVTKPLKKENLEFLEEKHKTIKWAAIIFRLTNDLATSSDEMKRGDVLKSIQCYMHETGASEEAARKHMKHLINESWMDINKYLLSEESPSISKTFIGTAMNLVRMAQCMYQFGDGHSSQDNETQNRVLSLIIDPIPLI
nr:TPS [Primula forbesii]